MRALKGQALGTSSWFDYRPDVLVPLVETFGACSVHTSPPSTPGFVLLRVLRALSEAGIDPADALGGSLGVTVEAIVEGNILCETALADRAAMTASVEDLIGGDVPKGVAPVRTGPLRPRGDTIGVAAMDDDGWAVAIVQSIFSGFGSAVLEPTTGILMHNRGSLFSLDPGSPNVIAPGKRPRHTLMPVMTTDHDGTLRFVAASMGGPNQPQIHAQVLLRLLAGSTYAEAVRAPRWLIGPRTPSDPPNAVYIEEDVAGEARSTLAAHDLAEVVMPAAGDGGGHMNVVGRDPDGALSGAADVRSDGRTAVVDLVS